MVSSSQSLIRFTASPPSTYSILNICTIRQQRSYAKNGTFPLFRAQKKEPLSSPVFATFALMPDARVRIIRHSCHGEISLYSWAVMADFNLCSAALMTLQTCEADKPCRAAMAASVISAA